MATVDLEHAYKVTSKGKAYWYAWKGKGAPRLKGEPGSEAFLASYAEAHSVRKAIDNDRIKGLLLDWKASDAWILPPEKGGLAESTKLSWRTWLPRIEDRFGELSVKQFDRHEIRIDINKWLDQWKHMPRSADTGKQVLSVLLSYAVSGGKIGTNPCIGIPNRYSNERADIIWSDADIARMQELSEDPKTKVSKEIVWALRLACLTGLRRTDLLKLSWSHIDQWSIEIKTGKSRVRGKGQRSATIPKYDELDALLREIPKRATTVLTTSAGRPWKSGFGSCWNNALKAFGETDLHFNDSRGTFATKVYQTQEFTLAEIGLMLGWSEDKVERIINRYVRRDSILKLKIQRMREASKRASQNGT